MKETIGSRPAVCYKPRPLDCNLRRPDGEGRGVRGPESFLHIKLMSQHRSLRSSSTSGAKRNVLKRFERVEILKKRNQWKSGDRVTGLRKTRPEA